jgi:sigma-B regulation protein RsbU (phosphoserine phosphatase)
LAGYEIAGAWRSAGIVGGDYFDVLPLNEDALGICIADVAGKGMPAALLMSNLQAAVRGLSSAYVAPHRLCKRLNSLVYQNTASDRFITFFYAQLDGAARRLSYVNAGHNAPFLVRRDGSHERLREGGGVLGIFDSQNYEMGTVSVQRGDRVLLFTDGVTEACNSLDEEFGEARLLRLLEDHRAQNAPHLQEIILAAVSEFSGGQRTDDATLVVLAVGE